MLARHVVQSVALHPVRDSRLNTVVFERDEIDRLPILLRTGRILSNLRRRKRRRAVPVILYYHRPRFVIWVRIIVRIRIIAVRIIAVRIRSVAKTVIRISPTPISQSNAEDHARASKAPPEESLVETTTHEPAIEATREAAIEPTREAAIAPTSEPTIKPAAKTATSNPGAAAAAKTTTTAAAKTTPTAAAKTTTAAEMTSAALRECGGHAEKQDTNPKAFH